MSPIASYLPNALSLLRLAMTPVLVWLAWYGWQAAFLSLLLVAFITDALDGALARRFNVCSEFGAQLDSWGDIALYLALAIAAHLLWPREMAEERVYVMTAFGSMSAAMILGLFKFGGLASYHTWMTKVAAVALALGCIIMFSGGPHWPFRLACVLIILAALEQSCITLYLRERRADIKSVWHLLLRRQSP
ncbi:CDP-alcohol phosphatidyltransferase family protein [Marinimicrobium alkaliphilum]|uniref:CDP-alcohol phosphatidyltransferase family protein n=1 Tax=Marinimicrobium alkaliphilum TaxID=2202654 RepID=UPI000DBA00A7|nr:CDP-alcohol phosphatidyltransferase family protein [Marinimicrobium alkaliphilum]